MQDPEISEMAARLEEAADDDHTFVHRSEDHLVSNRAGFLRCAALFLRAAVAPYSKEGSFIVDVDPKQMVAEDTDVFFSWFERREEDELEQVSSQKSSWKENIQVFLVIALWLSILGCFLVGLATIFVALAHVVASMFS